MTHQDIKDYLNKNHQYHLNHMTFNQMNERDRNVQAFIQESIENESYFLKELLKKRLGEAVVTVDANNKDTVISKEWRPYDNELAIHIKNEHIKETIYLR